MKYAFNLASYFLNLRTILLLYQCIKNLFFFETAFESPDNPIFIYPFFCGELLSLPHLFSVSREKSLLASK